MVPVIRITVVVVAAVQQEECPFPHKIAKQQKLGYNIFMCVCVCSYVCVVGTHLLYLHRGEKGKHINNRNIPSFSFTDSVFLVGLRFACMRNKQPTKTMFSNSCLCAWTVDYVTMEDVSSFFPLHDTL